MNNYFDCDHIFVFDGKNYTCLHCGLSDKYITKDFDQLTEQEYLMNSHFLHSHKDYNKMIITDSNYDDVKSFYDNLDKDEDALSKTKVKFKKMR